MYVTQLKSQQTNDKIDLSVPPEWMGAFERYQQSISEQQVAQLLVGQSAFSRQGQMSAWVVLWLMIYQRLHPKGTLSVAVQEVRRGATSQFLKRPKGKKKKLKRNTSAYAQARARLPLKVAEQVSDMIFEAMHTQPQPLPGLDRAMFLLDGSTILLPHSEDLAKAYPPAPNQHGGSHWPIMRVAVAHDVVTGLATRPCYGPMYGDKPVSEQGLTKLLIARLPEKSGVLGDRNYGVFSMAYHADKHEHSVIFRLTDARAKKLNGGVLPNAGTERVIRWTPSRDDRRNNPEIPADAVVEGRLLAFKLHDKFGPPMKVYLFTTLDLPKDKILELYGYRWNVETDLRSLKREVRLHTVNVKSKEMAEKELVLAVAAYNLTRDAMNSAGTAFQINPRQLSFSESQDIVNSFLPLFAHAANEQERKQLQAEMLEDLAQAKLPKRKKRRSFPREIWPRPCSFPKRKVSAPKKVEQLKLDEKEIA